MPNTAKVRGLSLDTDAFQMHFGNEARFTNSAAARSMKLISLSTWQPHAAKLFCPSSSLVHQSLCTRVMKSNSVMKRL